MASPLVNKLYFPNQSPASTNFLLCLDKALKRLRTLIEALTSRWLLGGVRSISPCVRAVLCRCHSRQLAHPFGRAVDHRGLREREPIARITLEHAAS